MNQPLADLVRRHLVAANGQHLPGLMLSERFHYDLASLLRQIGADPIPALAALQHRR